ncbi:cupin domain-containing protein [Glutamicibacter sp. MNS18]|uniref:cupin domain-containing protein n=1 Tax=Glutamicibacter sp. MNS18 TaxID=2989817 RepID=UPI002235AF55|nr:cupin domain-containing protein [Glutamicibacter sp. MNS18]MCW4465710.1 cupin domain-containing protein [Glutamicibacter sp. MNS18]
MVTKGSVASDSTLIARSVQDYIERNPLKPGKYAAKRIYAGPQAQITEIAFDAGVELPDHKARTPILVQVIDGAVDFTIGSEIHYLEAGGLIHLEANLTHAVYAKHPARITVTFLSN